ncbi:hypothetical protein BaRGS_00028618, partial [Batillaria attramentaria]
MTTVIRPPGDWPIIVQGSLGEAAVKLISSHTVINTSFADSSYAMRLNRLDVLRYGSWTIYLCGPGAVAEDSARLNASGHELSSLKKQDFLATEASEEKQMLMVPVNDGACPREICRFQTVQIAHG